MLFVSVLITMVEVVTTPTMLELVKFFFEQLS